MNAEIISIGTELLLGHIINTNAAYLAERLAEAGIDVYHQTTVGDNPERLFRAMRTALRRAEIVLTSGGLGPTVDDITIETAARLMHRDLVIDRSVMKSLIAYFKLRKIAIPAHSIRQALVPKGAKIIRNAVGTAPGLILESGAKTLICLPGPPRELEPMVAASVIPYIRKRGAARGRAAAGVIRSRVVRITGGAESQVNAKVKDLLETQPPTTVGIYAKLGEVDLKIMAKARNERAAAAAIAKVEAQIRRRLGNAIFGYDDETLEGAVAQLLLEKKLTIATAESCTGGLIAHRLTNIPGASGYFPVGTVTYANEAKAGVLGVRPESIARHGAVSHVVALEMARGIRHIAGTDIGISATGIAGPSGGTRHKPVGLVYIALVTKRRRIVREYRFTGSREEIKFQASQAALDLVRRSL